MKHNIEEIEARYEQLGRKLAQPETLNNANLLRDLGREHQHLHEMVEVARHLRQVEQELEVNRGLLANSEGEWLALIKEELQQLAHHQQQLEAQLTRLLLPADPSDHKNVILEIRSGTGGDEAALFCGELFQMYARYSESVGWRMDIMSASHGSAGGFKEIIVSVEGNRVYSTLKFESGVHRVQRVPQTETQGRVHTSAVTVAVLPEAEEVDVSIAEKDIRIDVYRSSGPGGQSVNTTDSAVRITHIPTGLVVACQDEKSQHKNKSKALKILRSRLFDKLEQERLEKQAVERRTMVKTGDRSEKIRTYNFPQDRLTDHRIGLTMHGLSQIMKGALQPLLTALQTHFEAEALAHSQL